MGGFKTTAFESRTTQFILLSLQKHFLSSRLLVNTYRSLEQLNHDVVWFHCGMLRRPGYKECHVTSGQ